MCSTEITQFSPDDFSVYRLLGTLGFMSVSRWGEQYVLNEVDW